MVLYHTGLYPLHDFTPFPRLQKLALFMKGSGRMRAAGCLQLREPCGPLAAGGTDTVTDAPGRSQWLRRSGRGSDGSRRRSAARGVAEAAPAAAGTQTTREAGAAVGGGVSWQVAGRSGAAPVDARGSDRRLCGCCVPVIR